MKFIKTNRGYMYEKQIDIYTRIIFSLIIIYAFGH